MSRSKKIFLFCISIMILHFQATAQTSDKVDIQNLEKKYWAAKDDDFSVVQNRTYSKAKRSFLNLSWGFPFNDPFSTGDILQLDAGYYFTEAYGISFSYTDGNYRNNDTVSEFIRRHGIYPDNNKFRSSTMINGMYVPFYAKMSLLDKTIVYFDMGLSAGLGTTNYLIVRENGDQEQTATSYQLSVFQQIFFTEGWAVRFDITNRWTTEERKTYRLNSPSKLGDKTINDTSILFSITYWPDMDKLTNFFKKGIKLKAD